MGEATAEGKEAASELLEVGGRNGGGGGKEGKRGQEEGKRSEGAEGESEDEEHSQAQEEKAEEGETALGSGAAAAAAAPTTCFRSFLKQSFFSSVCFSTLLMCFTQGKALSDVVVVMVASPA